MKLDVVEESDQRNSKRDYLKKAIGDHHIMWQKEVLCQPIKDWHGRGVVFQEIR